jgi:hypothetical protein
VDENGKTHEVGPSPLTTRFDAHFAYGYKFTNGTMLEAFLNVFNLFDQQPEVDKDEIYTFDIANPIVGGDSEDLRHAKSMDLTTGNSTDTVVERNPNFGNVSARQAPLSAQLGIRLTF